MTAGYLRLRPHVQVVPANQVIYLTADETVAVRGASAAVAAGLALLAKAGGTTWRQFSKAVGQEAAQLVDALQQVGLLQRSEQPFESTVGEGTRAYYQSVWGSPDATPSLSKHRVAIVGCGAMGGEVARHLIASGIGELILVDGDRVAECNLNRQYLYTLRDVGRSKVDAAAAALKALRADIRIRTYDTFIGSLEELEKLELPSVHAVVCCADTPLGSIFSIISEFATRRRSIFALATVGVDVGCWGPIIVPGEALPYHEWPLQTALPELAAQVIPATASFGPTNSLVAGALARDLLHVLGGDEAPSRGARVFLDFRTLRTTRVTGDGLPDVA